MKIQKITSILTSFLLFCVCNRILAQSPQNISYEHNGLHIGDTIKKQIVDYVFAGDDGENVVWDFSNLAITSNYTTFYDCDSDSVVIYEVTPEVMRRFSFCKDTLLEIGVSNTIQNVEFTTPIQQMRYPTYYLDTYTESYAGQGTYCTMHRVNTEGEVFVEADATGKLIVLDDTLNNTLRIHSIRTGSICMSPTESDSLSDLNTMAKQEIEERYQWFARGYRYPILETVSTSYYDDMDMISCIQQAYYCPVDSQKLLYDVINKEIQQTDSLEKEHTEKPQVIEYAISTTGSTIDIDYSLKERANITIIICSQQGMTYRRESFSADKGEGYSKSIDCVGLLPGTYILYLNVNGIVYSDKIKI